MNSDFKENKTQFERVLLGHEEVFQYCDSIINILPSIDKKTSQDQLTRYINRTYMTFTFDPTLGAISSLNNTSSFMIIKNEALRQLLVSWNDLLDDYKENENDAKNFVLNQYNTYLLENFNFDFNLNDPRTDLNKLKSFKFENLIKTRAFTSKAVRYSREAKEIKDAIDKIIELTEL